MVDPKLTYLKPPAPSSCYRGCREGCECEQPGTLAYGDGLTMTERDAVIAARIAELKQELAQVIKNIQAATILEPAAQPERASKPLVKRPITRQELEAVASAMFGADWARLKAARDAATAKAFPACGRCGFAHDPALTKWDERTETHVSGSAPPEGGVGKAKEPAQPERPTCYTGHDYHRTHCGQVRERLQEGIHGAPVTAIDSFVDCKDCLRLMR